MPVSPVSDVELMEDLLQQLSLKEKADLCSGADFWHLAAVERRPPWAHELGTRDLFSDGVGTRSQLESGAHY